MTNIQITVTGAQIEATLEGLLVGGMRGVPITFMWDDSWENLEKVALFRAGGSTFICPLEAELSVPWEALQKAGCTLQIGLYGISEDGSVATPTLWASVGQIQPGANPEGTPAGDPTLPMWKQAVDSAEEARRIARQLYLDAANGAFNGYSPVLGLDYWTEDDKAQIRDYVHEAILGGTW